MEMEVEKLGGGHDPELLWKTSIDFLVVVVILGPDL